MYSRSVLRYPRITFCLISMNKYLRVQRIYIRKYEKILRFLFWNASSNLSGFNERQENMIFFRILHCNRHWTYQDDNVEKLRKKKNPRGTCIPSGFWMKKSCIYVHVCPVIDCRITRMYFISVILILTNLQKSPKLAKIISQKLVIRHIWKIFKNFLKNCNVTDERCGPWTSCYTCIIKPMVICIRFQKICLK